MASFMKQRWLLVVRLRLTRTGEAERRDTRVTRAVRGSNLRCRARALGRRWGEGQMPRMRIVSLLLIAVLLLGAFPAAADDREGEDEFLALGDSVAFGFSPLVRDRAEPENFVGYPEALAKLLDADVVNASCPGEASGGFISLTSPLDNGCRTFRFGTAQRRGFPLHVRYRTAQLDFAVKFLQKNRRTPLVTIDLGANDLFVLQRTCSNVPACVISGLPQTLQTLGAN